MPITRNRRPTHPGRILLVHHIDEEGLTVEQFAEAYGLPLHMLRAIIAGGPVTNWMAGKLAHELNTSKDLWTNLQDAVDEWDAAHPEAA